MGCGSDNQKGPQNEVDTKAWVLDLLALSNHEYMTNAPPSAGGPAGEGGGNSRRRGDTMTSASQKLVVLMAEDQKHDILATRRAWKSHNIDNPLYVVRDGEECLDYLYRRGKYSDPAKSPTPGVLLLDIKMPRLDGLSVLAEIRKDEKLRHLPVTVLTTSSEDEDRIKSYQLGANAFIRKPVGFRSFAAAMEAINLFWALVIPPRGQLATAAGI